jgi:hypothetical protein
MQGLLLISELRDTRDILLTKEMDNKDCMEVLKRFMGLRCMLIEGKLVELQVFPMSRVVFLLAELKRLKQQADKTGILKVCELLNKYDEMVLSCRGNKAVSLLGEICLDRPPKE